MPFTATLNVRSNTVVNVTYTQTTCARPIHESIQNDNKNYIVQFNNTLL